MLRHTPITTGAPNQTADAPAHPIVRQDRQLFLGDDDDAQERLLALKEEVDMKLAAYGPDGPTKPKHALEDADYDNTYDYFHNNQGPSLIIDYHDYNYDYN